MKKIKLSRKSQNRNRMVNNLLTSLILNESVKTTAPKAKALKSAFQRFSSKLKSLDDEVNLKRYIARKVYGGAKAKAYDQRAEFVSIAVHKLHNRYGDGTQLVQVKTNLRKPASLKIKPEIKEKDDKN